MIALPTLGPGNFRSRWAAPAALRIQVILLGIGPCARNDPDHVWNVGCLRQELPRQPLRLDVKAQNVALRAGIESAQLIAQGRACCDKGIVSRARILAPHAVQAFRIETGSLQQPLPEQHLFFIQLIAHAGPLSDSADASRRRGRIHNPALAVSQSARISTPGAHVLTPRAVFGQVIA